MGVLPARTRKATKQLEDARATQTLVRVHRSIEPGHTNGYVCAVGKQLVLLSVVSSEIRYDGFQALRISDISQVLSPAPHHAFVERALQLRKLKRPRAPALNLSDVSSLLASASAAFPLVTVHREIADPDICHIGTVQRITTKHVTLREIDPNASWERKPRRYQLTDITRVDVGGAYEEALHLVGGSAVR